MAKVVHVVRSIFNGGLERGVHNLIKEGFYSGCDDFRLIEMVRGHGEMREEYKDTLGDRMITLLDPNAFTGSFDKYTPCLLNRLYHAFGSLRPDTAILSNIRSQILGRSAALPYPGMKVISFEHATMRGKPSSELALLLTSWRDDAVFGDTPETLRQRQTSYLSAKKPYYVPLAILEPQSPRNRKTPKTIRLLSLGQLDPVKNHGALILAAGLLMKEGHAIELTIAGEGPERKKLEQTIRWLDSADPSLNIRGRIHLPGFVNGSANINALFAQHDLYIHPSFNEGFSIATAEALAAGLPVAATNFAGIRDYGNEDNVRIIKDTAPAAIADTLRGMIVDYETIMPKMREAALETARQRFSREAVQRQWIAAQEELLLPRYKHRRLPWFTPKSFNDHPSLTRR